MYFKKLEIFGFKSFADRTLLNFEPGVTAIVGPNGCGKSNIFDSIRWALGEQSVKQLRGASMEDVIFNGTEKKPSLGFAEVSITFSNDARMLPVDQDEVTVTRRLFRSGESEYLLNKKVCRLKDIQEMLMGTGMGAEAYCLIQQGKVDLVVSAKPEDRRVIFDEAAGITKYKAKKKEALNKLKATEDNLLRVTDITTEVKRQIGSIERQANKARKYKVEYERLQELEVQYARWQLGSYNEKKDTIASTIKALTDKEQELIKALESLQEALTNEINSLKDIEQQINVIHSEEIKQEGQIDINNRQIGFNQERIENITINNEKLRSQKEQLIERCRHQQKKIEELKESITVLGETIQFNDEKLKENRDQLSSLERTIREAKEQIKDHEEKILNLTSNQVNFRNEVTDVMKEVQGALARKKRLDLEHQKVICEKEEIDQKLQNVEYQIQCLRGNLTELKSRKGLEDQTLNGLRVQFAQLEQAIDELEKKKLFCKSQKEFIEKLHVQYEDMPDPIIEGKFYTQQPPLAHHTGIIGKVKSVQSLDAQRLEQIKQHFNTPELKEMFEIVCETKFIELDLEQISRKIDGISQEIVTLVVEKDELSVKVQDQVCVVEQISENIQEKETSCSVLEMQRNDVLGEVKKLEGELDLIHVELEEVKQALVENKQKEEELNYKLDTINKEIVWCQNDIKSKQDWISKKLSVKEEITVLIAQLESEINSDRDKLQNLQDNQKMFTETLDNWLEEMKKIEDDVATQGQKKEEYAKEIENLQLKIEQIKKSKEELKVKSSDFERQRSSLGAHINQMRVDINQHEDKIEDVKTELHQIQLSEQELSFNLKGIKDRLLQTYKIDLDTWTPPVRQEVLEQAVSAESNGEAQQAVSDSVLAAEPFENVVVEHAQQASVPPVIEAEFNSEEASVEIDRLKKRCDAFGSVNLVAIEEFEELKGRFEFLTKQQSDLLEAKSQLMSTINKINRSTRQLFMDTFTKVSEEFRIYFRMLFGGGEAQLVLLDPENVLESGIEIIARPPGKKLQSISLLSGGEKSLTAIALIFGVFKVNPSPFCVLDEIDAALDESNVGRFSYLLKEFANVAQFIVITHNKKTISSADVMYGITMPETGCSRIVSVKFSDEQKKQEALAAV